MLLGLLVALVGCGDGGSDTSPSDSTDPPSSTDPPTTDAPTTDAPTTDTPPTTEDCTVSNYEPTWAGMEAFFVDHCDVCHPSLAGFDLHTDVAADVASGVGYYVVAGDPAGSILWRDVVGQSLNPMPQTGLLGCQDVQHVEAWILAGAPL